MTSATKRKKPTIVGIVVSPLVTLRRIREQPVFLGTALILFVSSLVLFGIIASYQMNDPKFLETMLEQLPQEIKELPESEQQITVDYIKKANLAMAIAMGGVATFFIPLLGAVFLKLIFFLLRHRKATFKQLYSFQIHLYTISVLAIFVQAMTYIIANRNLEVSPTSLAGILPISNEFGKAILLGFDVFTLWSLYLLKLGLVEITQLSSRKAWIVTAIFFLAAIGLHISNFLLRSSI